MDINPLSLREEIARNQLVQSTWVPLIIVSLIIGYYWGFESPSSKGVEGDPKEKYPTPHELSAFRVTFPMMPTATEMSGGSIRYHVPLFYACLSNFATTNEL